MQLKNINDYLDSPWLQGYTIKLESACSQMPSYKNNSLVYYLEKWGP